MTTEDALFSMADALIGLLSERGSTHPYISDEKFSSCLNAANAANPERFKKELSIYL